MNLDRWFTHQRSIACVCLLSGLVWFLSCSPQGSWRGPDLWKGLDSASTLSEKDAADAGAVVLLDTGSMEIVGDGDVGYSVFEHHKAVKILNSRGERYANVVIPYSARSTVEGIQARTVGPDGRVTLVNPSDIFDVTVYPSFIFFSDQRAKLFSMPAVEPGAIVEYRYRLTVQDRTFWHSWAFQSEAPTLLSRFSLVKPSGWDISYRVYGMLIEPRVHRVPEGFKSTHVWEVRDVPALAMEFAMPPRSRVVARLSLAPLGFRHWEDVSRWYHALVTPRMDAEEEVTRIAREISADTTSDVERLRRIHEWVREKVRYLAVEIDIGGFQPHAAEDVCINRYGDCKDMVTLLCTLAREVGLNVYQVLVSTWHNGAPDTTLPSPLHFNHVIAYAPHVGKNGTWLDPTEKGCPFERLPWYDQGLPVLVVGEGGRGEILVTPRDGPEKNKAIVEWEADLRADGSAAVRGRTVYTGALAAEIRQDLFELSAGERRRWLEGLLAKDCSGVQLDSMNLSGLLASGDSLMIWYLFHTAVFATPVDSLMVLRPGKLAMSELPDYFRAPARIHPIRFRFGMQRDASMRIQIPKGWHTPLTSVSDSLGSRFGWARSSWVSHGPVLLARSSFLMNGEPVPAEEYRSFQEFLDGMRIRDLRELSLRRSESPEVKSSLAPHTRSSRHMQYR